MEFQPLYYSERLTIINPHADVGIATLWTPPVRVISLLRNLAIDLDPATSRVAVIANLYGKGFAELIRNLLWNPQITHLLVLGQDLSGSRDDLVAFFESGLEPTLFADTPVYRIKGRTRILDNLVGKYCFFAPIQVTALGTITDSATAESLVNYFAGLTAPVEFPAEDDRLYIPIPEFQVARFPSEPRSHSIVRASPLEAWLELMFHLVRFGHWVTLEKGQRRELQNLHVVVTHPSDDPPEALARFGFTLEGQEGSLRRYQEAILDPTSPEVTGLPYTYGHRLRAYFRKDNLDAAVTELRNDPESRHVYLALWDSARDLDPAATAPCWVSLFFRKFEEKLTLTATFRTHNARDAWLKNLYGLMAVQHYVASRVDLPVGPITVMSHSISLQKGDMDEASRIAKARKSDDTIDFKTGKSLLREDPNGYFSISLDRDRAEIVLEHSHGGVTLAQYRGRSSAEIRTQLERDVAISLVSHALYVGEQLAKAEIKLKNFLDDISREASL